MFLTPEEIFELTQKRYKPAQIKALCGMGIQHKVRADGSPVVLRSHIEKEFDGHETDAIPKRKEPNWSALDAPSPQP